MSIAQNLERVREGIGDACVKAGVPAGSVTLVAVSKTFPASDVLAAYDAGQRVFGENRVQEWKEKAAVLPPDIAWNLIGHLQTNKVKFIIGAGVALLQSLDRAELAQDLQKRCTQCGQTLDVLIQLNLSREDTKSGVYAEDLDAFLDQLADLDRLRPKGLMTIGPNTEDEAAIRSVFAQAKTIYDRLSPKMPGFEYLSMGMSHDYRLAIEEGSNMVRIGSSIFGARTYAV